METNHKDIVEHTIEAFVSELTASILDGWAVSPTNPGDAVGYGQTYIVSMYRDGNTVERFRQASVGIAEKPKMTRAEILQKARDSKKVKLEIDTVL